MGIYRRCVAIRLHRLEALILIILSAGGAIGLLPELACSAEPTFRWDANTEPDLAGYRLYQGQQPGGPYEMIEEIPLVSLSDPNNPEYTLFDAPDGLYFYVLTAYDAEGLESNYSDEACVSTIAGDANHDGIVNIVDKVLVRDHFAESGDPCWVNADVNCDGVVNIWDKVIVRDNFGQSAPPCP